MNTGLEGTVVQEFGNMTIEGLSMQDLEYLGSMEGLQANTWEGLSVSERLSQLRILETKLAEIQGRPPCAIVAEDMPKLSNCGYYDGEKIHINRAHLELDNYRLEAIDTIAHEGRHAYQHYAVMNPGFHPNIKDTIYWAGNQEAYFSPKDVAGKFGFEYYENQPTEIDARLYAGIVKSAVESGGELPYAKSVLTENSKGTSFSFNEIGGRIMDWFEESINPGTLRALAISGVHAIKHYI